MILITSAFNEFSFNYFFKEIFEAGIVLKGSEIKSVRLGKINIADSYAIDKDGEIFLVNSHIPIYKQASYSNHNPYSERKLLLNKKEINKIISFMKKDKKNLSDKVFASNIRLLESDWHIPFNRDYYGKHKQQVERFWSNIDKVRAKVIASY